MLSEDDDDDEGAAAVDGIDEDSELSQAELDKVAVSQFLMSCHLSSGMTKCAILCCCANGCFGEPLVIACPCATDGDIRRANGKNDRGCSRPNCFVASCRQYGGTVE